MHKNRKKLSNHNFIYTLHDRKQEQREEKYYFSADEDLEIQLKAPGGGKQLNWRLVKLLKCFTKGQNQKYNKI